MSTPPTPASFLKAATRAEHEATENLLAVGKLLQGPVDPQHYEAIVRTMHAAWSGLAAAPAFAAAEWAGYRRLALELAAAAERDLMVLTALPEQAAVAYPEPFSPDQCFGAAYVQFGSLLGGTVIYRTLAAAGTLPAGALNFYAACARYGGGQWRGFVAELNDYCIRTGAGAQVPGELLEQALLTFRYYRRLFAELRP